MNDQDRAIVVFVAIGLGGLAGCGGNPMTSPTMGAMNRSGGATELLAVTPAGSTSGVPLDGPFTVRFSRPMAAGMEQFVDLHRHDPSGPVVPIECSWSADRTLLTCVPTAPLAPHTQYALHIGGGMMDADDHLIDMEPFGMPMGGQWLFATMMTSHAGHPWSMMGGDWHNPNGSYGMFFTFTTA